jgi:hypothetical protein
VRIEETCIRICGLSRHLARLMKGEPPGAMHPGGRGSPAMQLGKNDWMDRNKQAEQIGKLVNIFAMRVMEAPPEERQAYLGSQIGGFRRTFEHA